VTTGARSDEAERAAHARELLADPLLREALAALSARYLAGIRGCAPKDDLGRYRLTVALNVVDAVERHLRAVVETGVLSEAQGQELAAPKPRWIPRF
jgi:hypothetical protein